MRIRDWSSDVCSSDLVIAVAATIAKAVIIGFGARIEWARLAAFGIPARMRGIPAIGIADRSIPVMAMEIARAQNGTIALIPPSLGASSSGEGEIRSEERRVGKECVSTCSFRGSPDHEKQHTHRTQRFV